jgi:Holliday junction DNA helicase RuvA
MIGYLKGHLFLKTPTSIILLANGVGYELEVSLSTFSSLPETGQEVSLYVYTYVKENALKLFGFSTFAEKRLFAKLIDISGIGPRLALNILSRISPEAFNEIVQTGDIKQLKAIPGIGRKMAQRILLELKDKWEIPIEKKGRPKEGIKSDLIDDVVSALMNLGYQKKEALTAVQKAMAHFNSPPSLEDLIKETLRQL